jgi:hypothetical protein
MEQLGKDLKLEHLIDNIKGIYESNNLLEILMDFERVLDNLDIYAYVNWAKGELVEGPISSRHWVSARFMWPKKLPPDPAFLNRLKNNGIDFKIKKDKFKRSIHVKNYDDFKPGTFYPKQVAHPVWTVEIWIPKFMISEVEQGYMELGGQKLDMNDINDAYDKDLDKEGITGSNTENKFSE